MYNIALHLGYQTSRESFSVLWKQENVFVEFDSKKRNLYFHFPYLSEKYKLEISYENIWQIQHHQPRGQAEKFLLIQLLGAPRIYVKDHTRHWVREVDFTPSCCIGQSSALCLEVPQKEQIPKFHGDFVSYKKNEGPFVLKRGSTLSCNSGLVPIVSPPEGFDLPYKILFKINSLIQHGCLPGQEIDANFYRLVDPKRISIVEYIESALDKLSNVKECCFEPASWVEDQYKKYASSKRLPKPTAKSLDDGFVYVHRVLITPSKVYFCGPEVNLSNRVLRNYHEYIDDFLRVSFVDEDWDILHATVLSSCASSAKGERRTGIYDRILSILRNGIVIGAKKFEFLAYSNSQLRENSVWMFASRTGLTASDIREWMGDFREIRNVAKYASRLGQSFGSSRETVSISRQEVENIPDVEVVRNGIPYCFSDGIGKISAELAREVATKCGLENSVPSAFQIRYGGYKGVVAVDPTSSKKLSLRKSMCKYKSKNRKLDVLEWSRYRPCFLNRQIITLLSTLGVKDRVFEKKQKEAIDQLDAMLTDPLSSQEALELIFPGERTKVLKEMLLCGYQPDTEPFLSMMLETLRASKLIELRLKSRIFIPNGRCMMGCLDETGTLEYGEVFVQISRSSRQLSNGFSDMFRTSNSNPNNLIFEGKVVVAKNPCLHPGDVRVLKAVDVPALHHLTDCVVFPQKGKRPHPNECSGSDLDGDLYFVCWDPDLIPPRQIQPMEYIGAKTMPVDHDVTIEEVQEYFVNYILNDRLGIIDNAHIVFADSELRRAMSPECIELAQLHSIAVDSPKSGVVAKIPHYLRVKKYPDFMEKSDKRTYKSERVIGKLFREVKDLASLTSPMTPFTSEVAKQCYDPDMEVDGFKDYISDAFYYKREYDRKLVSLMDYYGIETEAEILSGHILTMSKSFGKRRDMEQINYSVMALRKEAKSWFNKGSESDSDTDIVNTKAKAKASAWYYVTYHHSYWGRCNVGMDGAHFLSFPWCVSDKLIQIKKDKMSNIIA
ncbi:probable RNA-dependent RNA polymerase 1 [Quercus lobata]|uniref:RNA-dependent RNA polymerase n=1 Tax=Quercus lobata TaxID=97700 RepID=A0A7N2L879_QUELO|nr:probable RNA-dependent RNA polymerase 1 [Quercus lobata]